jgi:hypothetical protein
MTDNRGMDSSDALWVQKADEQDFAPEGDPTPAWQTRAALLGHWQCDAQSPATALELALADLTGQAIAAGLFPWAAWAAHKGAHPGQHWGEFRLCHWHVSNGQVSLFQPQLPAAAQLDALWSEIAEFIAVDGLQLVRQTPERALVHGAALKDLPTAAWSKVLGRPVGPFLPPSNLLKRLQNELQMWLYTHPALQGMAQPVNSVWISGTGSLTPALARQLDEIQWAEPGQLAPAGARYLQGNDTTARLWRIDGASTWQRLWRSWRGKR